MNLKTNLPMYVYTLVADYCRKAAITQNNHDHKFQIYLKLIRIYFYTVSFATKQRQ